MIKSVKLFVKSASKFGFQYRCASQGLPQLSSETYKVIRKKYATVQDKDLDHFRNILGKNRVITDESDVLPYNIDWVKHCRGQSKVVLKPSTAQEVSKILSYCNEKRLAVCPQGGNTSVAGGAVPVFDEVVLNLTNMNKIISLDDISGALICEAGCVLENLDSYVREHGLIMPLDLGAKGTCQIGGNVSTNAGGLRLLRYGNLHGSVLGLEAVRADGTIVDCLKALKKDNTGYHLKHLFIGSEGTLGVVTKVAIHCPAVPKAVTIGFFGVNSFEDVLKLFKNAKSSLGEIISAFEMCDHEAINGSVKYLNQKLPISEFPFYVLIETHGSNEAHDEEKLSNFLKKEMNSGLILDGTITSEPTKMQHIWKFRESIPSADTNGSCMYAYDVSLSQKHYYELVPILRQRLGEKVLKVSGFGHIGDGNVHINVVTQEYSQEVTDMVEPFIFEEVAKRQGSVSAEHGIGLKKPQYMHFSKDESAVQLMRDIKQLMDPNGILNPYKVRADGTIVDCLKALKKDNTGYHLKHLFIGSEGTLGVVTKVAIHCPAAPKAVTIGFFGVNSFEDVLKLFKNAKSSLGEIISAFEMCDHEAINSSVKYLNQKLPISEFPFYVLIETHGSNEAHDEEKLSNFLKKEMNSGLILDGTITSEPTKMQHIWKFRESIPLADTNGTCMYAYDISLPQKHYYELVPILRKRLGEKVLKVNGFGHIGDGNVHINVVTQEYSQEVTDMVEPFIFEEVAKRQGSVSAEHGIGLKKPQYMHFSKDESAVQLMRDLKQLMDPNGILNPYKVLPEF